MARGFPRRIHSETLLQAIRARYGDEARDLVWRNFGGTRLYIPSRGPSPALVALIGEDRALAIGKEFAGLVVEIPSFRSRLQDEQIIERVNAGRKVSAIAVELGLTERHIYNIVRRLREAGALAPRDRSSR